MKQKITLVQKIASLEECQTLLEQKQIPLVLKLDDYELELLNDLKSKEKQFIQSDFKQLEEVGKMYQYAHCLSRKNHNYMYIDTTHLRNLIESNRIYITDFIDYEGCKKYIDYIYQPYFLKDGSGIVFRNTPRIFGKKTDHFKLVKAVETRVCFKKGKIILSFSAPKVEHTELESLCAEIVRNENDSQQFKKFIG